jgi:hypothetical protein
VSGLRSIDKREDMVELLNALAYEADQGKIKSIAISCVTGDGEITGHYAFAPNANPFTLIGAIQLSMSNIVSTATDRGTGTND